MVVSLRSRWPNRDLNGAQIGARLEKMCGEAVAQGVWMDFFL